MVTTICGGETKNWDTRAEAEYTFLSYMLRCDAGSERDRYLNVYLKLKIGYDCCTDSIEGIV